MGNVMGQATAPTPATEVPGSGAATDYAVALLAALGWASRSAGGTPDPTPDAAWAASGAMALTGEEDGEPLAIEAPVASCADGAGRALVALGASLTARAPQAFDGAALLGEKAALATPPLRRAGTTSTGGSARLLACQGGRLALNLARPDDESLLPAWLEGSRGAAVAPWEFVASELAGRARDAVVTRGRGMGLAVAGLDDADVPWLAASALAPGRRTTRHPPRVVDLSSLWAGPLCGQLLGACGAEVVKVESMERPDGARRGSPRFFELLNAGKRSVSLPFGEAAGRRELDALVRDADIVIESSRPRALAQLGIDAEQIVREAGVTWVSLTGYGRRPPGGDWVAFGDDAAIAAGLVAWTADGRPCFAGDAIADPLTGLHAAVAALASWGSGGGRLLDISLAGVARRVRTWPSGPRSERAAQNVAPPRARPC